jgi:hypothetical protein
MSLAESRTVWGVLLRSQEVLDHSVTIYIHRGINNSVLLRVQYVSDHPVAMHIRRGIKDSMEFIIKVLECFGSSCRNGYLLRNK